MTDISADAVGSLVHHTAPDGAVLAARLAGPEAGPPVVLVHGFNQGSLAWVEQLSGPLAARCRLIAPDLRGHGGSKAGDLERLGDGATWAGDVRAVLQAFAGGRRAVLVGWSYGARVVCEFLARHGEDDVAGLVFAGASTQTAWPDGTTPTGPGAALIPPMESEDDAVALPATIRFLNACVARPLPARRRDLMIAVNARVAPEVRRAMRRLVSDNDGLLDGLTRPTLVIHGADDTVVRPVSAENIARRVQGARLVMLPGVGHSPFLEAPAEFDRLLGEFVDGLSA